MIAYRRRKKIVGSLGWDLCEKGKKIQILAFFRRGGIGKLLLMMKTKGCEEK